MTNIDWEEHLGEKIKIKIDRPLGSKHPEFGFIYPVNYGYVPGFIGGDGDEQDAYLLGVFEPVKEYEGRLIGIIHRRDDIENKLVVAPKVYSADQIRALTEFQERWFASYLGATYDKPYWPDTFSTDMPDIKKAIEVMFESGYYSSAKTQTVLNKGYSYVSALCAWFEDNGVVENIGNRNDSKPRKLKTKNLKDALKLLKDDVK